MMGHKEQMKGGDEYDAFTGWRRVIKWKRSERAQTKRAFNRRIRRAERQKGKRDEQ